MLYTEVPNNIQTETYPVMHHLAFAALRRRWLSSFSASLQAQQINSLGFCVAQRLMKLRILHGSHQVWISWGWWHEINTIEIQDTRKPIARQAFANSLRQNVMVTVCMSTHWDLLYCVSVTSSNRQIPKFVKLLYRKSPCWCSWESQFARHLRVRL